MKDKDLTQKKRKKRLNTFGNIVLWVFLGLILLFSVSNVIDRATNYNFPLFGIRTSVVVSESMSKDYNPDEPHDQYKIGHIQKNDAIFAVIVLDYNSLQVGDVITYYSPSKGLVCHRITEIPKEEGKQLIITKGDANAVSDAPIEFSQVKGIVLSVMPGLGTFISFIQSGYMLAAVLISIGIILLVLFVYNFTEDRKNFKGGQTKDENKK